MNKKLFSSKPVGIFLDILLTLVGTSAYALGVHVFTAPNQIAPGGVTGLATAVHYLTGFPIGTTVALINLPLLAVGYGFVGRKFFLKTLLSTVWFTVFYDMILPPVPVYRGETILAALFGGVLIGCGLAIVFLRGGSTGGTDIISKMIQQRWPHFQLGKIVFLIDMVVIAFATAVFRNLESALFAVVAMFTSSQVMDSLLYGMDQGKMAMIITEHAQNVSRQVSEQLERSTTLFEGTGGYTGEEKTMVLCAVRKNEFYKLKKLVHQADPKAFMIAANSNEVLGEGFKPMIESQGRKNNHK